MAKTASCKVRTFVVLLAGIAALAGCGCHRKAPPPAEDPAVVEQRLLSEINQVLTTAETEAAAGQFTSAVARVAAVFNDPRYGAYRSPTLDAWLRLLVRAGDEAGARQRALTLCGDAGVANAACGFIYRLYRERHDATNGIAWATQLLAQPRLAPDLRRVVYGWLIDDNLALGQDEQALKALTEAHAAIGPADDPPLWANASETLFAAERLDAIERLAARAAAIQPPSSALTDFAAITRVRLLAARGDWEALGKAFNAAAPTLRDAELEHLMRAVFPVLQKNHQRALMDQCADAVIAVAATQTNRLPQTVAIAARTRVENVMASDKTALPRELDHLLRQNVPPRIVAESFTRYFYGFADAPNALKELLPVGERLLPLVDDEDARTEIKTKLLDASFLLRDYDRAIATLEAGVPGHDAAWHKTALIKVRAHRALERGEPREAVKYFREFMDLIRAGKDEEVPDPVTNVCFPREMILGRNAKRIGDILAGIPDAAEAAKAYAEARDLYAQALTKCRDPDARKVIEAEAAQLSK